MNNFMKMYHKKTQNIYKATLEITHICNLNCKHCYIDDNSKILRKEEVMNIVDVLYEVGVLWIVLTGGEIFTYPWFTEIYIYMKRKGFIIDIKTNALLMNDEIKDLLKKYPPRKIDISVYGLSNDSYAKFTGDCYGYDKLEKSLNWLFENNFTFQLIVMAIRENYHDLLNGNYDKFFHKYNCNVEFEYDIIRNFGDNKKLKVDLLNPNEIVKLENKSKLYNMEIEKALQEVDKLELNCSGGIESIFIDVEGKIHICIFDEVAFELDCLIENKYLLIDRNKIITSMYNDSKCSACKNHIGCKRCPIKQKLTLRDETNEWRCELANLRKNFFVESHR